jgi:polysaccharide chain length determinant protein (PEP-CTERM system associated)
MIRNIEFNAEDLMRVARRRWWIIPLCVIGCSSIAGALCWVLPKVYTSQTLVLVEQPTVPEDYVRPVVSQDVNHRLATMQEQILSRSRLQPIIEEFHLYQELRGRVHMDDLIERLRSSIAITPVSPMPGTQAGRLPGFYVGVTLDNPQLAQQVCTKITSMFMERNARAREQQAVQTTSFLSQQLTEGKARLDEHDSKLAEFKRRYLGSLPEEAQTNLGLLTGMNMQLEANADALNRARQDKEFDASLLAQQEAAWKASRAGHDPETLEEQLNAFQEQLASMQAHYTPDHPDIVKLKRDIEELKVRIADAAKTEGSAGNTDTEHAAGKVPPHIQQLRIKLYQDELNIRNHQRKQEQIEDQIRTLQVRLQAGPVIEQQFKELTRNYQEALDFYNDLLKKRDQSAMATDLEHEQQSEQFRILDPPNLPVKPSFPKTINFVGEGAAAGLALAAGLIYLLAFKDKSMHTEREVELCLKLPVLVTIPTLDLQKKSEEATPAQERRYDATAVGA